MVNVKEHKLGQNTRMSFSKSSFPCELPNLVEVQTKSFKWFLEEGLMEVLRDVSPITDHSKRELSLGKSLGQVYRAALSVEVLASRIACSIRCS